MNIIAPQNHVVLVEILELTQPFDEVEPVMCNVLGRLGREGVPELVSMQFYKHPLRAELSAVIMFSNSDGLLAHTQMISAWPEFKQFAGMIKLVDMRVHGRLSPAVEAWIKQFNGPLEKYEQFVAGFVRSGE